MLHVPQGTREACMGQSVPKNIFHRGKPLFVRSRAVPALLAVMLFLTALPGDAQLSGDATFFPVTPCTVVDTRYPTPDPLANGTTRDYQIAGNVNLTSQGGSSTTGCNIPAYWNGQTPIQAVELLITAITNSTTGSGYIAASAGDTTPSLGAMVTVTPGALNTNTGPVALAQTGGNPPASQFRIKFVGVGTVNVLVRVVGYYAKPVQTVWVHPVPGDPAASGTALLNALAGITGSASQHYVLKLEPGIYDVGTATLTMKPFVDIAGSGEQATVIQGAGAADFTHPVVSGAPSAELRELQVKCTGGTGDAAGVPILITNADTRIRQVTVTATGSSTTTFSGIRIVNGTPEITATTIHIDSGGPGSEGIRARQASAPKLRDVHIVNAIDSFGIVVTESSALPQLESSRIEVDGSGYAFYQDGTAATVSNISGSSLLISGGSTAKGIYFHGSALHISHSTVSASGSSASTGIDGNFVQVDSSDIEGNPTSAAGIVSVGGSKLSGTAAHSNVTCAGVWNASYTFFSGPACP